MLRWEDRREPDDVAELLGRVWSVKVTLPDAPRNIGFGDAASLGTAAADLVSEDHTACRDLADQHRANGELALLVPSAALPGTQTLVLLGPRVLIPWQLKPIDLDIDVPAAVTADRAGPPLAVLPHVRWRGASHAALLAWQAGNPYEFLEPVPTNRLTVSD